MVGSVHGPSQGKSGLPPQVWTLAASAVTAQVGTTDMALSLDQTLRDGTISGDVEVIEQLMGSVTLAAGVVSTTALSANITLSVTILGGSSAGASFGWD